jgi:hypothetical protein
MPADDCHAFDQRSPLRIYHGDYFDKTERVDGNTLSLTICPSIPPPATVLLHNVAAHNVNFTKRVCYIT